MGKLEQLRAEQRKNEQELRQLENRQKLLLNKERDAQRRARTRRLIEHGAVLEGVFPVACNMTGEEVKAFLTALSRLPGAEKLTAKHTKSGDTR